MKAVAKDLALKRRYAAVKAGHSYATIMRRSGTCKQKNTNNYFADFEDDELQKAAALLTSF